MFEQRHILVLLKEYIEIVVIKTITLFKSSLIESRLWGHFGGLSENSKNLVISH